MASPVVTAHRTALLFALAVALSPANPAQSSQLQELSLGDGRVIGVRDAGFVQVQYTDEGFGLTIESTVVTRDGDGQETTRPISKSDLQTACEVVLRRAEARIGSHPPDYVFFQEVSRVVDTGLLKLRRTKSTFFETRTDRCRPIDGAPREVK